MSRIILVAAALMASSPAFALGASPTAQPEARIHFMRDYLETVVDPERGIYIRDYAGHWYYARVQQGCPRLTLNASLRFNAPGGNFDRFSTISADGWRCLVSSVVASDAPPGHRH